jgi:hypothetical protein
MEGTKVDIREFRAGLAEFKAARKRTGTPKEAKPVVA